MMKPLKTCIAGLLILGLSSCNNPEYQYNIPEYTSCRNLSTEVFCINSKTRVESSIEYSEALGFSVYPLESEATLKNFALEVLKENSEYARCRNRRCIIEITKKHNGR